MKFGRCHTDTFRSWDHFQYFHDAGPEKGHTGNDSDDPEKTSRLAKSGYGYRTLELGYRFIPNVSMRKMIMAITREEEPKTKIRLLACRLRKTGCNIRKICMELDTPHSAVRDWLVRMHKRDLKGRFNGRRMGKRSKLPREPKEHGFESGSSVSMPDDHACHCIRA